MHSKNIFVHLDPLQNTTYFLMDFSVIKSNYLNLHSNAGYLKIYIDIHIIPTFQDSYAIIGTYFFILVLLDLFYSCKNDVIMSF